MEVLEEEEMKEYTKRAFGCTSDGRQAQLYTLENEQGMKISVTDYGATLVGVYVLDAKGCPQDVVLGYEDAAGYEASDTFFGAIVGRNANRIGGASFEINGQTYTLDGNDNEHNNLHSGNDYYCKRFWELEDARPGEVTFALHSPDGDQGYPGNVDVHVTYALSEENVLSIKYYAVPDADTILNLTNHSYFNLDGHQSGSILEQEIQLEADAFTRADKEFIATGEIVDVTGTPMDFRERGRIGERIDDAYEATQFGGGYDHNWVLRGAGAFRRVASMFAKDTKIAMDVWTDLPGMQVYSGNFLVEEAGKEGAVYKRRQAVCFETQYFPNAIHYPQFESPICKAFTAYKSMTQYRFYLQG
jgi:aldose 1-epimerase